MYSSIDMVRLEYSLQRYLLVQGLAWIAGAGRKDLRLLLQELLEEVSDLGFQVHYC